MRTSRRLTALLLSLVLPLSLAACGGAGKAEAASMWLVEAEGAVAVTDDQGADVAVAGRLGLFSGYGVATRAESYGWIDLDETKLTKMDENSGVSVQKDGKDLVLTVNSGSLFFNITEPLAEDETLEIRSANMVTAIRGTKGWVTQDTVCLLDGTVTVTAGGQTVTVSAGEMAYFSEDGGLDVRELTHEDVPAYVLEELAGDGDAGDADKPARDGGSSDENTPGTAEDDDTWLNDLSYYTVEGKTYDAFGGTLSDFDSQEWEVISQENESAFTLRHRSGFILHNNGSYGTNLDAYGLSDMPDVSVGGLHFGDPREAITEAYPEVAVSNDGDVYSFQLGRIEFLHIYFDEDGNIACFDYFALHTS